MLRKLSVMSVPMKGTMPPNTPLPMWYGRFMEVKRILVGKSLTKNAAMGPWTMVTKMT